MYVEIILLISVVIFILALAKVLKPWNKVSLRFATITAIICVIVLVAAPITMVQPQPNWTIEPQTPDTSGWGQISGSWFDDDSELTIPIILMSDNQYKYNNTHIPFIITPIAPVGATISDYTTIVIELTNYSTTIDDHSLLRRSMGAYYANITDPDGVESGDSYICIYNFKYLDRGTFYIDFKLNQGSAELADIGDRATVNVHMSDYRDLDVNFKINFVCVGS